MGNNDKNHLTGNKEALPRVPPTLATAAIIPRLSFYHSPDSVPFLATVCPVPGDNTTDTPRVRRSGAWHRWTPRRLVHEDFRIRQKMNRTRRVFSLATMRRRKERRSWNASRNGAAGGEMKSLLDAGWLERDRLLLDHILDLRQKHYALNRTWMQGRILFTYVYKTH